MLQIFKQLAKNWANWLGDRDMELALRRFLTEKKFFGDSAKISDLRLVAIQRPGWLQVFTFTAEVKSKLAEDAMPTTVFGLLRQDERFDRCDIEIFEIRQKRDRLLQEWSQGLLRTRGSRTS